MMTYNELKGEFRCSYDSGDPWGSVMQWLFAIAEESYFNRDGSIAAMLQYSPGMVASEPDLDNVCTFEGVSDSDLEQFADLLHRFDEFCRARGLDY